MTEELKNYIIILTGRGSTYCYMANGKLQDVANRCQVCVTSGFECYVYAIEPSGNTQGFMPTGSMALQRVYHLYDARDEYQDEADAIISKLDAHSEEASKLYLDVLIKAFQEAKDKLQSGS